MKRISLTQGKFALVDDEDFDRIDQYNWHFDKYAMRGVGIPGSKRTKHVRMAQEILNTSEIVDHKDGSTLNNQKNNLRIATEIQNLQNRRKTKSKVTSKYKGVSKHREKWRALIYPQNVFGESIKISLGIFVIKEEAAKAYDKAARYHFEEFAALNFPEEDETACM